ncbi:endonuclease/exonuclease/phosphatase family protein [Striga asiatica]|uniref:Endonuclease/exonuclease/phosphatase family protein n=1 Tax=Striga asiatica TaxID=4170 RepID=A0A5A7NWV1_STRAF|nr:endonuclease/exonuclease/phosphatase family protein [Striga asiatica]
MLKLLNSKLRRLCLKLRWPATRRRRRPRPKVAVKNLGKSSSRSRAADQNDPAAASSAVIHPSTTAAADPSAPRTIRFATFNAASFSMAPAVPHTGKSSNTSRAELDRGHRGSKSTSDGPKSILKHSPRHPAANPHQTLTRQQKFARSRLRVSINLPDNEISLRRSGQLSFEIPGGKTPERSSSARFVGTASLGGGDWGSNRTVLEVLREVDADVVALQDVRAEEEKDMTPLSELAGALGMRYAFAESWAPEYGNAILSKWPIKRWKAQRIFDDSDFRMKQINSIIQSTGVPHILAGGLNSLDETDYSHERWTDIVKYYEEMGKPTPKFEVMKYLKSKGYVDAKYFAGECESVVMIAKGVQGTCKYGTRVDYILSSANAPYKFVPGSYSVISSKGTSDHHIVKVDLIKVADSPQQCASGKMGQERKRIVKITHSSSPTKCIWKTHS